MNENQSAGDQAGFGQEADAKAIDDLLERINGPNAAVILSQADKTRIRYGLQFLQLEISRMASHLLMVTKSRRTKGGGGDDISY